MNNIKTAFSIKDLENLSGVKAHTIRIWEKRYNLLEPLRSETNIRSYNIENLQKLLNVVYLQKNGHKISKIAALKQEDVPLLVREIATRISKPHHALNAFKVAMFNFDKALFQKTYNNLIQELSFKDLFYTVFIPFLEEIGLLWQTDTINPAHEHFVTSLMKQKILINIEKLQNIEPQNDNKTFVLFLPENEMHDLGLLFLNYELECKGYHVLYLGESVPTNCLEELSELYDQITFITYLTVKPEEAELTPFLNSFSSTILNKKGHSLNILGNRAQLIELDNLPKNIIVNSSIVELVDNL